MPTNNAELHTRLKQRFDETTQECDWKTHVARDMNVLLARASTSMVQGPSESELVFAQAAANLCERVAHFEDIKLA